MVYILGTLLGIFLTLLVYYIFIKWNKKPLLVFLYIGTVYILIPNIYYIFGYYEQYSIMEFIRIVGAWFGIFVFPIFIISSVYIFKDIYYKIKGLVN